MPSSSATCSTTTVSTSASRSDRVSARCSIGRRKSTSRVGVAPAAAHQRRQRHRVGGPVVGDLGRVLDGVLDQAEPVLPALVDVGDDVEDQVVEALAAGTPLRAAGRSAATPGPRMPRPRRSRRRVARLPTASSTAASLIGRGRRVGGYRRRRESCPSLFAHGVRPRRGHDADLRLRRPDGRARPARDLRRAARLRPLRRPQRAALAPRAAGRCCGSRRTRPPRDPRATTCSRSPTPSARPARPPRAAIPGRRRPTRPAARSPAAATCACSPPTDAATRPADARLRPWPNHATPATLDAIFKAYDVRGTVPDQLDDDLARAPAPRSSRSIGATHRGRRPRHAAELARPRRRLRRGRDGGRCRRDPDRARVHRPALLRLRQPRPRPARCSPPATTRRSTTASSSAAPRARRSAWTPGWPRSATPWPRGDPRRRRPGRHRHPARRPRGVRRAPADPGARRRAAG